MNQKEAEDVQMPDLLYIFFYSLARMICILSNMNPVEKSNPPLFSSEILDIFLCQIRVPDPIKKKECFQVCKKALFAIDRDMQSDILLPPLKLVLIQGKKVSAYILMLTTL